MTADQMLSLDFILAIESAVNSITVQGTAEEGYRVDSVSSVGPFGPLKLEDTPYSITVVPHALLQNLQPSSGEPVFEMIPGLQVALPLWTDIGIRINSRGFWVDTREDGFRYSNYNIGPVDIEDKESTELLSGLSGFLYGTMDPGGFANYAHLSTRQEPCQTREACK